MTTQTSARDITNVMRELHPRPVRMQVRDISLPGHTSEFLLRLPQAAATNHDDTWLSAYLGRHLPELVTVKAARNRVINRGDCGHDIEWLITIGDRCSRCGNYARHVLAWQHHRLCPVCREYYEYRLGLWREAQPVTVGQGAKAPGHVVEAGEPSLELLGSLAIIECPHAVCRAQPGELHGARCPEGGEIRGEF
jgi:hypothetical protein